MNSNKILSILKSIYSKNGYIFIGINIFSFIIIFFILNEDIGGGIFMRLFAFLFCSIVGGLLGVWWSRKEEAAIVSGFRRGAGTFLILFTLLMWSNNNYVSPYGNSSNSYPKKCKANCGEYITSSSADNGGYHFVCKPGKDGKSVMDRAKNL
jgi:hypothetical protein